jgi:hypothetical protein
MKKLLGQEIEQISVYKEYERYCLNVITSKGLIGIYSSSDGTVELNCSIKIDMTKKQVIKNIMKFFTTYEEEIKFLFLMIDHTQHKKLITDFTFVNSYSVEEEKSVEIIENLQDEIVKQKLFDYVNNRFKSTEMVG